MNGNLLFFNQEINFQMKITEKYFRSFFFPYLFPSRDNASAIICRISVFFLIFQILFSICFEFYWILLFFSIHLYPLLPMAVQQLASFCFNSLGIIIDIYHQQQQQWQQQSQLCYHITFRFSCQSLFFLQIFPFPSPLGFHCVGT